jgi:hypothetical protein
MGGAEGVVLGGMGGKAGAGEVGGGVGGTDGVVVGFSVTSGPNTSSKSVLAVSFSEIIELLLLNLSIRALTDRLLS